MDFSPDETQQAVAGLAAEVLSRESDPDRAPGDGGYDEQAWRALAGAGLLSLALPGDLGGDDLGVAGVAAVLAETGRTAARIPAYAALALGVLPVVAFGDQRQLADLLPAVGSGDAVLTAAIHEPSTPLPDHPVTAARATAEGWTLTGVKTAVPYAAAAHRILVTATISGERTPAVFLVAPGADGVTVTAAHASSAGPEYTVTLESVAVAHGDRLGDADAVTGLNRFAVAGALAVGDGALAASLELTTEYIRTREQFGRPLATMQAVAGQIADVYVAARTVHLAAMSVAWRLDAGLDPTEDLAVAAYWLAFEGPPALQTCHHLHGGVGVDVSYPLHRYSSLTKDLARYVGGAADRLDRVGELAVVG